MNPSSTLLGSFRKRRINLDADSCAWSEHHVVLKQSSKLFSVSQRTSKTPSRGPSLPTLRRKQWRPHFWLPISITIVIPKATLTVWDVPSESLAETSSGSRRVCPSCLWFQRSLEMILVSADLPMRSRRNLPFLSFSSPLLLSKLVLEDPRMHSDREGRVGMP